MGGGRFIRFGERHFNTDPSHWWPGLPVVYLFAFGGGVRILATSSGPPIQFEVWPGHWAEPAWGAMIVLCPLMAVAAWWLIERSRRPWSSLAGLWLRLGADTGLFAALMTFHIATVLTYVSGNSESRIMSRYMVGAVLVFVFAAVVRDMWVLAITERLAKRLRQ